MKKKKKEKKRAIIVICAMITFIILLVISFNFNRNVSPLEKGLKDISMTIEKIVMLPFT